MKKTLGLFATVAVVAALAQTPPAFEVTSVRPRTAADRGLATIPICPNGRFLSGGPIRGLLLWANNIKFYQLLGMPDWDPTIMYYSTGLYAIEAKASGPVTEDVCKLMVQTLMKDRFKMAAHRESRETPVYALVVGKKGPKLKIASDSDAEGNKIVVNGNPMGTPVGRSADFKPPGWSMEMLADFLGVAQLGRPVVNRTNLNGLYRISLNFSFSFPQQPDFVPPQGSGPDIKTALEEQMGLTLESTKAPIEMLIIDHIEKPDAN